MNEPDPFEEGRQAYLDGLSLSDCQYREDSPERVYWEGGYMEAEEQADE